LESPFQILPLADHGDNDPEARVLRIEKTESAVFDVRIFSIIIRSAILEKKKDGDSEPIGLWKDLTCESLFGQ
jgi:hypothetical protein